MITVRGLWRIFGKYSSSSRVVVEYLNAMTARAPCGANKQLTPKLNNEHSLIYSFTEYCVLILDISANKVY